MRKGWKNDVDRTLFGRKTVVSGPVVFPTLLHLSLPHCYSWTVLSFFFQLHFQCPRDKVVRGCAVQFKRQRAVVVLCCTVLCAVAVLVTFFICWAPFHAQRVLTVSVPDGAWTATLIEIQSTLFYVSG